MESCFELNEDFLAGMGLSGLTFPSALDSLNENEAAQLFNILFTIGEDNSSRSYDPLILKV